MNAEKFTSVLTKFDATLTSIAHRSLNSEAAVWDVQTLIDVLRELDKHRLEMEAAEADSSCRTCGATLQFYDGAICLKCQEKARQAAETARSEAPTLVDVGDLATRRDLERIENRLKEIEWRADETRGAYVAHMKYVHRETSTLEDAG